MRQALAVTLFIALICGLGCERFPSKVSRPPISETVAEGKQTLKFKAESTGTIYLERSKRHQMLWRQEVVRGDEIIVDLEHMQLTFNGRKVDNVEIELATYRLLFAKHS